MKKRKAYLLVASENIIFAAANVAMSLNCHSADDDYDILIYHTGLTRENYEALRKIPNVKPVRFQFQEDFVSTMLGDKGLPGGRWKSRNSLLTAAHYEIFPLLDEYHIVIWLDADMLVQGDIKELENYGPLGLAYDLNFNEVWKVKDQFVEPVDGYDMDRDSQINACIVATDELADYHALYEYCYEVSRKQAPKLKNLDQAVFQLMIQDFNIKTTCIPWNDFVCHANHPNSSMAKLVHFGTEKKPWNDQLMFSCFPEWFRYHMRWLELGGLDFDRSGINNASLYWILNARSYDVNKVGWTSGIRGRVVACIRWMLGFGAIRKILNSKIYKTQSGTVTVKDLLFPIYKRMFR